jgi:DNA invertase Pin-like site-specific DNA recombinase
MTRAALYLRVSTDGQTTENQRRVLVDVAARRGWIIVKTYEDAGISGSKDRSARPGFDAMLKGATRHHFDVLMFWSIDRLGRSAATVATTLDELGRAGVAIYADKEAVDATTPIGRAMLQMAGIFAELERGMIRQRVQAGLDRAKAEQAAGIVRRDAQGRKKKPIGRPKVTAKTEESIRARLAAGDTGMLRIAAELGVGSGTVQRVAKAMRAAA